MSPRAEKEITRFNICYPVDASLVTPAPPPTDDVNSLFDDDAYRAYYVEIGGDLGLTPRVDKLSTVEGPPSTTVPFFNDYTNVLTVAARDEGMLRRILRNSVPIEKSILYAPPAPQDVPDSECSKAVGTGEHVPNGVRKIEAPEVWSRGITGAGVSIAIVDTGYEQHTDLPIPRLSKSFVPGNGSILDRRGHGTYVTGIALARQNRSLIVGVAHHADLIVARAGDDKGKAEDCWVSAAICWSVLKGSKVINVCLVADKPSDSMRRAILFATTQNSIICAAAGNAGVPSLKYPAAYPETISVGATQLQDKRCAASNWTNTMTTYAPGCPILSTSLGNSTTCHRGSSAATPHVSGVVALMLQKDPNLSLDAIRRRIQETGEKVMNGDGVRRINAQRCVV